MSPARRSRTDIPELHQKWRSRLIGAVFGFVIYFLGFLIGRFT